MLSPAPARAPATASAPGAERWAGAGSRTSPCEQFGSKNFFTFFYSAFFANKIYSHLDFQAVLASISFFKKARYLLNLFFYISTDSQSVLLILAYYDWPDCPNQPLYCISLLTWLRSRPPRGSPPPAATRWPPWPWRSSQAPRCSTPRCPWSSALAPEAHTNGEEKEFFFVLNIIVEKKPLRGKQSLEYGRYSMLTWKRQYLEYFSCASFRTYMVPCS